MTEKSDGTGTISLGPSPSFAAYEGMQWPCMQGKMPPRFDMVPRVQEIYSLMRSAQA